MKTNKIITGLNDLDKILEGGLKAGELSIIMGQPSYGKTMFHHTIPTSNKCPISDALVIAKENGFDTKGIVRSQEKIGDIIFPVTYFPNGMVFLDYPDRPLIPKKNEE